MERAKARQTLVLENNRSMKCIECNHRWNQEIKIDEKGFLILTGIKCPKCSSENVLVTIEKEEK
jgi:Zn finger protein HypA/HybF involved in hydrogenase expression